MSFVHECNKNNIKDTKRDEFSWHNKVLTNRLRLLVYSLMLMKLANTFGESAKPYATERVFKALRYTYIWNKQLCD